jgi:hypothetical protein
LVGEERDVHGREKANDHEETRIYRRPGKGGALTFGGWKLQ